jgi:YD repeat-containing protein
VLTATDPLNQTSTYAYLQGDLYTVTTPLGHTTTRFTDAAGRALGVTDPLGRSTRYTWDNLNQLTKITDPLGSRPAPLPSRAIREVATVPARHLAATPPAAGCNSGVLADAPPLPLPAGESQPTRRAHISLGQHARYDLASTPGVVSAFLCMFHPGTSSSAWPALPCEAR